MKAATTSLHYNLGTHPGVFTCTPKEPSLFSRDYSHDDFMRYAGLFRDVPRSTMAGESSTNYTKRHMFDDVPKRIHQALPEVRLIYLVRDPFDRIISHYRHEVDKGRERRTLEAAVLENPKYVATTRYAWQLDPFLDYFPREQILILVMEDFLEDTTAAMRRVLEHLDVDDTNVPGFDRVYNTFAGRPRASSRRDLTALEVSEDLREAIIELIHDDIIGLRKLLGSEFHCWGIDRG